MLDTIIPILSGPAGLAISLALIGALVTLEFGQALDHPRARFVVRALWALAAPLVLAFAAVVVVGLMQGGAR